MSRENPEKVALLVRSEKTKVDSSTAEKKCDSIVSIPERTSTNQIESTPNLTAPKLKIEELLNENILCKKSLKEYGLRREELLVFTHSVLANQQRLLGNSYIPMTEERILSIYESLYD